MFSVSRTFSAGIATIALAACAVACGGDGDDEDGVADGTDGTPASAVSAVPATPTDVAIPTPAPKKDEDFALSLAVMGPVPNLLTPTVAEFRTWPTVDINGKKGVTLATLAEKSEVSNPNFVVMDGTRSDSKRFGTTRYVYSDHATTTILVMDATGNISVESSTIPKPELLIFIQGVAFNQ